MGVIKIIAGDTEIDFVKESLTIRKENNALSSEFKVNHSSVPFLVIENEACKKTLGTRDITSVNKKKVIEVEVYEGDEKYYGQLQVLSYLNGYRKCNLKYVTRLLQIFGKKIADHMPIVSVIPGETDPVPYVEESVEPTPGSGNWALYPMDFIGKCFPEVKWQFPIMTWRNKFGVNLPSDDPWSDFRNKINDFSIITDPDTHETIPENYTSNGWTYDIDTSTFTVYNWNVAAPQVFLLSPLFYMLQLIGFKATGDFVDSPFIQRILMLSTKDNLTKTNPGLAFEDVTIPPDGSIGTTYYWKRVITPSVAGTYLFKYEVNEPDYSTAVSVHRYKRFIISLQGGDYFLYDHLPDTGAKQYAGTIAFDITDDMLSQHMYVLYSSPVNALPEYTVQMKLMSFLEYYQMHPTINVGRFLPDWTFGTYLNEIKKAFNLIITPDDLKKELRLDFVKDYITAETKHIALKSLNLKSYDQAPNVAYLIKYENDEDAAIYITAMGAELFTDQVNDFLETIESKFKYVPVGATAELSEEVEDKDGVGLMIYDPANPMYISKQYEGQTLAMDGAGGIYDTYHKIPVKYRLNAGIVEVSGPFTKTELQKMLKVNKIYLDSQAYNIASADYSDTVQGNYLVKLRLESITF